MDVIEISLGVVLLIQIISGISVNAFLLLFYTSTVSASHKFSSSDLIFAHLAMANTIILLTSGLLETMSAWGLRNFLNNIGCKILLYLYRVSRGLAICTTCLLSIFQAITISPGTSRWVGVKARLPKCIIPCCLFSWIFNLLLEMITPMNFTGPQNNSSVRYPLDLKYCSRVSLSATINQVVAVVLSTRDLLFVALMSVASGYMVYVLCRHHRRVQHLHRPGHSPRAMPEVTAAKRVVALVMLYVLLYGRQSITLSFILNMKESPPLLLNAHMVLSFTFSTLSPFLVIHSDRRMRIFVHRKSASSLDPS
ncbi:vomeronasal 1 receptor ornAnaV1R3253 [Ornithorhynchus anatinus]|uniref:vomeronasal 1 receptor ornAnaV1R3253 n=1 Tax=Ornithorhynchus anatinus TaxID=9258 RepID=UPI000155C3FF|nr:vomeronasal 1 receptor ornAnaV1R3253 [Ornithorhynchus anatinus]